LEDFYIEVKYKLKKVENNDKMKELFKMDYTNVDWANLIFSMTIVFILLGFLNGLLPCGMVYLALGSAMSTGKPIDAALFMALFGLGTMPALLMVAFGGQLIGFAWRRKLQVVLPVFIFGMGLMLILRGLNLGIPMISPHIETNNIVICHN
jgi:sulfite exporter TauE/SafE